MLVYSTPSRSAWKCLNVQDSIIVPLREQDAAIQVLRSEYRRAAGVSRS
jgi:hypothetical protein